MINGLAATREDWDPTFIEGLASKNELLLVNTRGMGTFMDDGSPFTISELAADCARVIRDELDRPTAVLGWSLGGFIAQALALEHPQQVSKLVLLSTDAGGPDARGDSDVIAQLADTSPPPAEQARRLMSLLFDDQVAPDLYAQFGDMVAAARARLDQDVLDRQKSALDGWHRAGVADRLAHISVPTLVAVGTADRVVPPYNSLRLATAIPGAWLLQFENAGHALMAQHPTALSSIINEFLAL